MMCKTMELPATGLNPGPDAFATKMVDTINAAGLALMISVGHRTGLFDAMAPGAWSTSEEIASRAGLNERYVREWLGAMTTGRVVEHDPSRRAYRLPSAHAASLTRSSPANMAAGMQFIAVLGYAEDAVVEAFRHGGGVPYSGYRRFHEVMAEESAQTVVAALFDQILPLEPGLIDRLERGIDVLDVGCGRGRALIAMARRFPASRFRGLDGAEPAIDSAREAAQREGLTNVGFAVADAAALDEPARYDLITAFDAIHDQARPDRVLRNIARSLRSDGLFLMQDISGSSHVHQDMQHPLGTFLYTISCMHCMSVSLAAGGMGLGAMWGRETAERMLGEAGFRSVRVEALPHDVMNFFFLARP